MRLARCVALALLLALAVSASADAQGPSYPAQPPTKSALYRDGQDGRYLLGGTWLYRSDTSNVGVAQGWWQDVASTDGWTPVSVPNAYNAGDLSNPSMDGYVGWYRKDFTLPAKAFARYVPPAARRWIIRFESVNYRATVWLNGRLVGAHTGAYLPFEFDLSGLRAGVNRLVVRVDNRHSLSDLPPNPGMLWWNFGGLLREVYLRAVQGADLQRVRIRTLLPCRRCAARIQEQVVVRNVTRAPQSVRLSGTYGPVRLDFGAATIAPRATWTTTRLAMVTRPRLWSPQTPSLYRAGLTLSDSRGRALGGYVTYSGIRQLAVAHGRLELNFRPVRLRGVGFHEQNVQTGAALDPSRLSALVGWIRGLGATVIRTHYPVNPEIEELADRYGILIWSEIPVYHVKNQYFTQPGWEAGAQAMLRSNILANQNHPSVMLWSIGNELATPADSREAFYIARAAALAHRLDPTRPVGMAIADWPGVPCQGAYHSLDALGFNDYFGWFDAGGGGTDDRDALSPFLDSFRACYPKKALFVSEYGSDGNRHGPVEERGTYEFQSSSAAFHLGVFAAKPWLSGAVYWLIQDFASAPGWGGGNPYPDPPWVGHGLVDRYGSFKPAFGVVSSIYHATTQFPSH